MVVMPRATPADSTMRASHSGQAGCGVTRAKTPMTTNQNETFPNSADFNKEILRTDRL